MLGRRVMEFCPKCGMRLILEKAAKDGEPVLLVCPRCDFKKPMTVEEPITRGVRGHLGQESITVISEDQAKIRTMPVTKVECPKCGNREAYWWMVQTRGADEASTQFFRCTKCGYTWREMD